MMDEQNVKERLEEYARIRQDAGADEVALAEAALYLEEAFDILLSDEDIRQENLGSHADMERFVLRKLMGTQ